MIKVFNHPGPDSTVKGWKVSIDGKAEYKYRLKLYGDTLSRIGMIIDNDHYKKLTVPAGIHPYSMSTLVSVKNIDEINGDISYIPILRSTTNPDDDVNIIFMHFETGYNETITDVQLTNCTAISYYINTDNFKHSITIAAIATDTKLSSSMTISYGFIKGRSLSIENFTVPGQLELKNNATIVSNKETIQLDVSIEPCDIILPKFDLSTVCISE